MIKKPKNSTSKIIDPITITIDRDWYAWRERPVSEAFIEQLSDDLVNWAMDNEKKAMRVSTFLQANKISRFTAKHWRSKFPRFDAAYIQAMEAIGNRREIGACEKIYDPGMIRLSLHTFDPEWHETINKYHSDMKKEEEAQKQELHIHYDEIPTSALVKKKKQ